MINTANLDFDNIVDTFSSTVYKIAFTRLRNRQDADDVFQDVFVKFATANKNFDSYEHIKAWLIKVTINCCNKFFTKNKNLPLQDYDAPYEQNFNGTDKTILNAIMQLDKKYRTCLYLFYYEDLPIKDIAISLNISTSNVKVSLLRAKAKLKDILGEDLFSEEF